MMISDPSSSVLIGPRIGPGLVVLIGPPAPYVVGPGPGLITLVTRSSSLQFGTDQGPAIGEVAS
jgi:hypothetical protein